MQQALSLENGNIDILKGLNPEQKKAVTHNTGPLLIVAGAGTGKTTVITKRIAYLIEQKIAKPSEILALTFTEKAAAEMEERVDELVPYGYTDMWISTFHAFGDRLLRDFSIDLGLPVNFKVLTKTEQAVFLRENLFAFDLKHFRPLGNPTSHIDALLSHFSRLKDELISPEQYLKYANKCHSEQSEESRDPSIKSQDDDIEIEKTLELANAYERYQELMIQAGNLDFGDQIYLTYKLLSENKKVLKKCQDQFKFILVDEFQDTNYAQNEIVKLLARRYKNITVVGDDDQSIYRFRGASISNILDFKKSFKNVTQIVLNKNYRSTKQILNSSYKLIQHNNPDRLEIKNKINKKLTSTLSGDNPELLHCDTLSHEADTVAKKIKNLKTKHKLKNKDFAILVRANNHAQPFIQSLNLLGIPYAFSGASGLYAQGEIKMLIALLKTLAYSDDNLSLYRLATSELYGIKPSTLTEFHTRSKRGNRSIFNIISYELDKNSLLKSDANLQVLVDDVKKYREKIKEYNAGELLYKYLTEKKYLKKLSDKPSVEDELKIQNIAKFFERIANYNHSANDKNLIAFLNNLELLLEVGDEVISSDIDPDIDAVNVLTAHASKGLEWPVVFIVNSVSDRFPGRKRREQIEVPKELVKERLSEGDFHLQEERRLFYVAATRAKKNLFLTSADDYGGKRTKKISQFVMELLDETNVLKLKKKQSPLEKIERFKKIESKIVSKPKKLLDGRIKLSRQQIDDYHTCPKKYYYAHVIRIPLLENHALMYGTAVHSALDHYFNRKIRGDKISLNQLFMDFKQSFRNVGFITREHEDQRFKSGVETLTKFFKADQKGGETPVSVEESFEFLEDGVSVKGRYDLIYKSKDGAEIRDFKTSQVKDQKDADRRIRSSTQMQMYALAWKEKNNEIPKTTLYFIESGLKGEKTFSDKDLDKTKGLILDAASGIKRANALATPGLFECRYCPYNEICSDSVV